MHRKELGEIKSSLKLDFLQLKNYKFVITEWLPSTNLYCPRKQEIMSGTLLYFLVYGMVPGTQEELKKYLLRDYSF